jgi:hypothetical protein
VSRYYVFDVHISTPGETDEEEITMARGVRTVMFWAVGGAAIYGLTVLFQYLGWYPR